MNRRQRILVLDADERLLIELERVLEEEGFNTTTTWDFGEAIDLLSTRSFDLLVIGDHPPEIAANELFRQLGEKLSGLPSLVMHPCPAVARNYFCALGAIAVVGKDCIKDCIKEIVDLLKIQPHTKTHPMAA